ncbi:MAG: hypothetical protein KJ060_11785 [Candidatus Hydrogenedentes bacterium]|nr:hypothetical protein [Candidatus Hydrogenedentota bacterium]
MSRLPRERKVRAILLMDVDKVALAAAAFVATIVLAIGLFYSKVEGFEVAFRVGLAFVVTYAVTFPSFGFIQRTARTELSTQEEARLAAEAAERAAAKAAESNEKYPGEME